MRKIIGFIIMLLVLTGCSPSQTLAQELPTITVLPPVIFIPTETLTPTNIPEPTHTPAPTATSTCTPTATWMHKDPGAVTAPILLYHHITSGPAENMYSVSREDFAAQAKALKDLGYTTITVARLANVLVSGGELPERPLIITFDDGNLDVYENAFPVLKELGFTATVYLVSSYLDAENYLSIAQIQEMAQNGWEFGSHSRNHLDLTQDFGYLQAEMRQSKLDLESKTGLPIESIAYPFGKAEGRTMEKCFKYGYLAGMGLGSSYQHSLATRYYLSRIEIRSGVTVEQMLKMLPWQE